MLSRAVRNGFFYAQQPKFMFGALLTGLAASYMCFTHTASLQSHISNQDLQSLKLKPLSSSSSESAFNASQLWEKNGAVVMVVRRPG